jgi:hypothetical protein
MAEMVICKSCGYVMEKGKLGDKCPACGVPAKMFLPYEERISARRKLLLSLDIHPVLVHFPQAFTATILVLALAIKFIPNPLTAQLLATVRVLGILLPFTVAAAFAAGMFDGKIRFRRFSTPLLKKKMAVGLMFFIQSVAIAVLSFSGATLGSWGLPVIALLAAGSLGCGTILALWGVGLLNARFPG